MRKRRSRGFRPLWDHLDDRCLPSGYTPAQVTAAYGLNAISFPSSSGAAVAGDGSGQTIAIVEVDHDPNIQAALDAFDASTTSPSINLDVIDQAGSQTDDGWSAEESMDVEWAHAIAPAANIVVVEADPGQTDQQGFNDLITAVQTASQTPGVSVVSMSWGFDEFSDEPSYDSKFTTPGITYIASSGDYVSVELARDLARRRWPSAGPRSRCRRPAAMGPRPAGPTAGGGLSTVATEPSYQDAVQSGRQSEHARRLLRRGSRHGVVGLLHPAGGLREPGTVGHRRRHERRRTGLGGAHGDRRPGPRRGRPGEPDRFHADPADALRPPRERFQQDPPTPDGGQSNTAINTSNYNTKPAWGLPWGPG